jgi:Ni,Fe-hydrogenase III large subunit
MRTIVDAMTEGRLVDGHRPWPRASVDEGAWRAVASRLGGAGFTLSGLWGEAETAHMAVLDEDAGALGVVSLDCPDGAFASIGAVHAPAIRLERAIFDLFGLRPEGAPDARPWLDHGRWAVRHPLGARSEPAAREAYAFLDAEGEGLHQIAVGPIHAGIIEPGHFRFHVNGETVVRLEQRLGYVHKGVESLMAGADLERAARLAGRTSGDSTVAYQLAFARAAEAALGIDAPPRAHWLRALMAEMERLANHLGDVGAICNDASFAMMLAHCAVLRERALRAAQACFGHRLMRDCIWPGGVSVDLDARGTETLREFVDLLRRRFPPLAALYDGVASLQDRTVGAGVLAPDLARRFGAGGYIGRASGRAFDARRNLAYPPYDELSFSVPTLEEGDVDARVRIRIQEISESLKLIDAILARLPAGDIRAPLPARSGEGVALVEGFRGDVLVWLRLDEAAKVRRCHLRDPSWFQWPLLEAAIANNIVADFPLCNKSFNCSYSGHDL